MRHVFIRVYRGEILDDLGGQTVYCPYFKTCAAFASETVGKPLFQFKRSGSGIGHRQYLRGADATAIYHISKPRYKHGRLSAAGYGKQ